MPEIDAKFLTAFQRACPISHKVLAGRRYLLPRRFENAYPNLDAGLRERQLVLLACALLPPEGISFSRRCELVNLVKALECDSPTVYLDLDLAQALVRTDLPNDLSTDELRLPWPGVRFVAPKELRLTVDERAGLEVHYLDVCVAREGELLRLSQHIIDDLYSGLEKLRCHSTDYLNRGLKQSGVPEFYVAALTSRPAKDGGFEVAAWANTLDGPPLTELTKIGGSKPLPEKDLKADVTGLSLESLKRLVFNVLLLLTHYELEPVLVEGALLIRKATMEGRHLKPELARARFLSEILKSKAFRRVRPSHEVGEEETVGTHGDVAGEGAGTKYRSHWRMGHWKRVHYGKGLTQQRRVWVLPYKTFGPEHEQ
jgi:hypothetical protein